MPQKTNPAPVAAGNGGKGNVVADKTLITTAAVAPAQVPVEPTAIDAAGPTDPYYLHVDPITGVERRLTADEVTRGWPHLTITCKGNYEFTKTFNAKWNETVHPRGRGWELHNDDTDPTWASWTSWRRRVRL
jgi:hypothetical protein